MSIKQRIEWLEERTQGVDPEGFPADYTEEMKQSIRELCPNGNYAGFIKWMEGLKGEDLMALSDKRDENHEQAKS